MEYMVQISGLRGTIKDGGILCSCTLCNGRRVSCVILSNLSFLFCFLLLYFFVLF